ncbi:MAG: YciI family protein [Hyphomonadaceae bacterium]
MADLPFLLIYDYIPDYLEKRTPFREEHLAHGKRAMDRGDLIMGGPCYDPGQPMALLIFRGVSREQVEAHAKNDPYVKEGIVARWTVREWTMGAGPNVLAAQ